MADRPSNLAHEAVWPTRAASRARKHVVPGSGVQIIKSPVVVPAEEADEPPEHIERRVYPPTPDTRDVRPPMRTSGGADALGRNKGGRR